MMSRFQMSKWRCRGTERLSNQPTVIPHVSRDADGEPGNLTLNPSSPHPPDGFLSSCHTAMGLGKWGPESPLLLRGGISMSVFHFLFGDH